MAPSRLFDRVKHRAQKAVEQVAASDKGGAAISDAVRAVQAGKRMMDEQGVRMIAALGIATKEDVARVGRKIGRLRKRLQALVDELD